MKLEYYYGTQKIEFVVIYRNRKNLSINIEPPNIITVIAPTDKSKNEIIETVKTKSKWIVQKLFEIREIEYRKYNREFINGESFLYLGRNYKLQIDVIEGLTSSKAKLSRGKFIIITPDKDFDKIKCTLESWYKEKAAEKIAERVSYYQPHFSQKPKRIIIKNQKKRWGSCTKDNKLLFNWKCIMAPSPVLDYIVVHEMCHLVHLNHSSEFWRLLKRILPDYKERKNWLRDNGIKYDL